MALFRVATSLAAAALLLACDDGGGDRAATPDGRRAGDATVDAVDDAPAPDAGDDGQLRDATDDAPDATATPRDAAADATADGPRDVASDATATPRDAVPDAPRDGAAVDPLSPAFEPAIDTDPAHYPANVWITGAMAKVQPDAAPGAAHWATLSAARNEFESFQVHVRAGAAALAGVSVALSDLVDARSGARIPAAERAVLFREEYLAIATPSDLNGLRGRVPDPLVPAVDPWVREPRNAFPARVAANTTQSFWVELHVPPGIAAGFYTGTVTVRAGATALATMPVRLKVWSFELPSTSSLPNFFAVSDDAFCTVVSGSY